MRAPHLSRRTLLSQALAMTALGGCAAHWDGQAPFTTLTGLTLVPSPEWMGLSWNDPQNVARWEAQLSLNRGMRIEWTSGLAVSTGGKYIALPVGASQINAITVVATETGERWRVAHPNKRVLLTQPTFSPDGESIAMIASPPTYSGNCEIWMSPLKGGRGGVLRSSSPRSMYWPVFSPDGRKIACFRDVDTPRSNPLVRPEYQASLYCSLFEYDIATGQETQVSDLIVNALKAHAAYVSNGRDFLVGARVFARPLDNDYSKMLDCGDGRSWCYDDLGPAQPSPGQLDGRAMFSVSRGAHIERFPTPARPAILGPKGILDPRATFFGADRNGNTVVGFGNKAWVCDDTKILKMLDPAASKLGASDGNLDACAISYDGSVVAGATSLGFVDEGTRVDMLRNGVVTSFVLSPGDSMKNFSVDVSAGASEFPE